MRPSTNCVECDEPLEHHEESHGVCLNCSRKADMAEDCGEGLLFDRYQDEDDGGPW
jgi:hypothetical protein